MEIAGGIYREVSEVPAWKGDWGSGGRAATVLNALAPSTTLHTYFSASNSAAIERLNAQGIKTVCLPRGQDIAFAYFHGLSRPYIEPPRNTIVPASSIRICAENILRFGFLEGSAIVAGGRVVYDPQSPTDPEEFSANGSSAGALALVMNEQEFSRYTKQDDLAGAARAIIRSSRADVVVLKRGVFGATVYTRETDGIHIPIYLSSRTFKIGTGDVFSAIFAHFWAQERLEPLDAADLASRAVSCYCERPHRAIDAPALAGRIPVQEAPVSTVVIYGASNTLGKRYTLQEAQYCINQLGVKAIIAGEEASEKNDPALIISDGLIDDIVYRLADRRHAVTILDEDGRPFPNLPDVASIQTDFVSAIYEICIKRS